MGLTQVLKDEKKLILLFSEDAFSKKSNPVKI